MNNNNFFKVGNMPYVSRNAGGQVSGIFLNSQPNATEFLPNDHPDILVFFGGTLPENMDLAALSDLSLSDIKFIRVIEDLVDLLMDKKIFTFTDLPEKAREKILSRKDARDRLAGSNDLVVPDEGIL
jgi:hypothetical protein